MKKLIIIRGSLGVGKTTVSQLLSQNFHLEYLSLDQIVDDKKTGSLTPLRCVRSPKFGGAMSLRSKLYHLPLPTNTKR
jgi:hypothetical protein